MELIHAQAQETKCYKVVAKAKQLHVHQWAPAPHQRGLGFPEEAGSRGHSLLPTPQGWATKMLPSQSSLHRGRLQGLRPTDPQSSQWPSTEAPGVLINTNKREHLNLKERVAGGPEIEQGL